MNDGLWVALTLYACSVIFVFGVSLYEWSEVKDSRFGNDKRTAVMNARIMAISPIWPVAVLCYMAYKAYTLYPSFVRDLKGRK